MTTFHTRLDGIDLLAGTWGRGAPHDQFTKLRSQAPVYWHPEPGGGPAGFPPGPGFWAIAKHADIRAITHDYETFSSERGGTLIKDATEDELAAMRFTILCMDPPRHSRYRKLVSRGFTARMVQKLTDEIERRAALVVDDVCERGAVDFVARIAAQVPVQMICEMMGLNKELWPRFIELSDAVMGSPDDPDYVGGADGPIAASAELYMLCAETAADRRVNPRDDLMTALVNAEVDGERLTDLELNLFYVTLVVAGNETTRNIISHAMLALIDNPSEAQRFRDDPGLWTTGVEEMLRWGHPIHNLRRTATRDTTLRGVPIRAGDKLVLCYASGNRDEDVFVEPNRFDVGRTPNDHLTFGGGGVHYCLGANLARAEARAMMQQLVERLPDVQLAGPVDRLHSDFVHGVKHMPVTFTPAAPRRLD
ncbi:cytochrome P450 [Mycolicibacterium moriokaense]|uniref:Steroid C26-monooxygenase n=1 Tax=Mycolicibacterium moriokaense TaxID=39691 RepID=A0A318H8V4_9MYCO|nr:cytochrome P450 [Mycolicibacterium moriokaense]PXX01674.1 cytochrome P450 [Mycolicibacterium moriokaense]